MPKTPYSSGGFDPSNYSEHVAYSGSQTSVSALTNLMSYTGKEMLERTIIYIMGFTASVSVELKVTIDGNINFDVGTPGGGSSIVTVGIGILSTSAIRTMWNGSTLCSKITGDEPIMVSSSMGWNINTSNSSEFIFLNTNFQMTGGQAITAYG